MKISPNDVAAMSVCGDCGALVGQVRGRRHHPLTQRGSCPAHVGPENEGRWDGFDFNLAVELCQCCGRIALWSGNRFSVWFCEPCLRRVGHLNGRHGRCVISPGRHSVHAGYMLNGRQAADPVEVHAFVEAMNSVWAASEILREWGAEVVRLNLEEIGLSRAAVVPAGDYLSKVGKGVSAGERFERMYAYLQERAAEGRPA